MSCSPDRYALLQLLRSRLAAVPPDPADTAAEPWDWTCPHRFSSEQRRKLAEMAAQPAEWLTEEFCRFAGETASVECSRVSEHYLSDLARTTVGERLYWATFIGPDDAAVGAVVVDEKTARLWLKRLLGDTEERDETASADELSPLEQSLLLDIAALFVRSLARVDGSLGRLSIQSGITMAVLPPVLKTADEYVRMEFLVRCGDEASAPGKAAVLIRSADLDAPAGRTLPEAASLSPDAQLARMAAHLYDMPITLDVVLGDVRLTLEETLSLAPDDILLLDRMVADPIDIEVEGRQLMNGRPAQSAGKNAVVITATTSQAHV